MYARVTFNSATCTYIRICKSLYIVKLLCTLNAPIQAIEWHACSNTCTLNINSKKCDIVYVHVYSFIQATEAAAVQRGAGAELAVTRQTLGLGYVDANRRNQKGT